MAVQIIHLHDPEPYDWERETWRPSRLLALIGALAVALILAAATTVLVLGSGWESDTIAAVGYLYGSLGVAALVGGRVEYLAR